MSAGVSSPGASNVCVRARSGQETLRQPRDPFLQVTSGSAPDCARPGPFCCQPVFTHPCFSRLRNSAPAAPSGIPPRGFMSPALAREPGLRAFWQGRPQREPAALARQGLSALLPLEWHQLGSRRVRPSPAPASQRLRRPASLRLQGRLCQGTEPSKGGKPGCLSEPRGSFVCLPKEVSSYRDWSVYSPSYFALLKKISFPH